MAYGFDLQNHWVPVAFLTGGFFSGLSGFLGMKTATYASARTANAARTSLNGGLRVAFRSGAVMGLVVVGLGLFDISFWYLLLDWLVELPAGEAAGARLCTDTHHHAYFWHGGQHTGSLCSCRRRHIHQGCRCGDYCRAL